MEEWLEIARIRFSGPSFEKQALDAVALEELGKFQKMLTETAKLAWRRDHPAAKKLPNRFEECTRLYIRRIEPGSASVPLEALIEEEEDSEEVLLQVPSDRYRELKEAARLTSSTYRAALSGERIPDYIPQELLDDFKSWGSKLSDEDNMEIIVGDEPAVSIQRSTREAIALYEKEGYQDIVTILGEVIEADVKQNRFHILAGDDHRIQVEFTQEQELEVTNALKEHQNLRLRVTGKGVFTPAGVLQKIEEVAELFPQYVQMTLDLAPPGRWIGDVISEIAAEIPEEEERAVPKNLSDNIDQILYGWKKE